MRHSLIEKYRRNDSSGTPLQEIPDSTPAWESLPLSRVVEGVSSVAWKVGPILSGVQDRFNVIKVDEGAIRRGATHLVFILVAALAIGLSRLPFSWDGVRAFQPLKPVPGQPTAPKVIVEVGAPLTLPNQLNLTEDDILVRGAVPRTIIPDRTKEEIITYVVQSGDTIFAIAAAFGLAPETIMWSNPDLEDSPDLLSVGQELTIIPVDGVYHQVGGGDTIDSIAATYKADPSGIVNHPLNELDPEAPAIEPGQWLIVPGGSKPFIPRTVTAYSGPIPADATLGSGVFGWPASGSVSQGFWSAHPGLDVAAWNGAPITAADSGHVVAAGWDDTGYGYTVVIDHGNGFQTLYAHLQAYYVDAGENVAKGQQIGEMGSTGNSTGPHVHFEIRQGTVQRNPVGFLP